MTARVMFRFQRPEKRPIHNLDVPGRYLIYALLAAAKHIVLYRVAAQRVGSLVLLGHEQRVEKRRVVIGMIHRAVIGLDVAAA